MGSPAPQGAEFQVWSMVFRANLNSDESEEAELEGKEQLRLNQKLGMERKQNHVFSSPPSVPMERNALARMAEKS